MFQLGQMYLLRSPAYSETLLQLPNCSHPPPPPPKKKKKRRLRDAAEPVEGVQMLPRSARGSEASPFEPVYPLGLLPLKTPSPGEVFIFTDI